MKPPANISTLAAGIRAGERGTLARAITLIESKRADHRSDAHRLVQELLPLTGKAVRLGITGAPGAGKRRRSEFRRLMVCDRLSGMTTSIDLSRDEILTSLRQLEGALRAKGVTGLAIFGSRARSDHRPDSDLDVLVDVDSSVNLPLFIAFDVQHIVQDAIGIATQATLRSELNQRITERISDDVIRVF